VRFFEYDNYEFSIGGEIVSAEDPMAALLLFKDLALPNEREDLLLENVIEVGDPDLRFGPRPTCCSFAAFGFPEKFLPNEGRLIKLVASPGEVPVWHIEPGVKVDYCPWCGSKLPELEVNPNPPSPLQTAHKPIDNGYCATCDERHICCGCHPHTWAWRIKA
jgi:hypothetical protein